MTGSTSFRRIQRCVRRLGLIAIMGTMLLGIVGILPAVAEQITGKRVALVIGNSRYRAVTPLTNPGNDARLMARTLQAAGFTLVGGGAQLDLDKARFDDLVNKFGQSIAEADVALFYYSGHGLQVKGVNYLVPISANPTGERDLDFQMVSADVVLHQMAEAKTKLNIVILDACRNNPFGGRGFRATGGGLAEMHAPEGTLISYATQPGNVASDGAGADSPFTTALTQSIRQPGMDLLRMFNQVGLEVKRSTKGDQQPWLASSPIDGDFFFTPGQGSPTGTLQAPKLAAAPAPAPAPAPQPDDQTADRSAGEQQVASNEAPATQGNEVAVAQMRPIERGFHCPKAGTVTMEGGQRHEWNGADYDNPHVCNSRINGVTEKKLFQFYDMNAAGVLLADDALTPLFNGETDDVTVHLGQISYEWTRAGHEAIQFGDKALDAEKYEVEVDASSSLSNHRGKWTLWYSQRYGLFLKTDYRSYVGPSSAEMAPWQVSAILVKGGHDTSAKDVAPKSSDLAVPAPAPAPTPAPAPAARPAVQRVAANAGGFHCPRRDTLASVNGSIVIYQGVGPDSPHSCVSKSDTGRQEARLFNFYRIGGPDARAVDDQLSGFFTGNAPEATVVVRGQRYTWRHAGTDHVTNHGEKVEVQVLKVETEEDGTGRHHGTWTILYDARDGLLLKGTFAGERGQEPDNWDTPTFDAG